jgi:hypothetical protein
VHFLKDLGLETLTAGNLRIEGGEIVRQFSIQKVGVNGQVLTVELDHPGDFAPYTLRLVTSPSSDQPPAGFDPLLSAVDFSFKVNCPSDFDCQEKQECPPEVFHEPDLNYLAKDFNSFRQLMLDRLTVLTPDWREQSPADLLHALIDLKAYVADYQSYQQDAVATEAYLGTARRRVSIRRHARLVDYFMHDGCNARAWVQVRIDPSIGPHTPIQLPASTQLLTHVPRVSPRLVAGTQEYRQAFEATPQVFETLYSVTLFAAHNEMCFYTWGDDRCCLPRGATRATLNTHLPNLFEGDILIFEEIRGPQTGRLADADLTHRHAVRLMEVRFGEDPLTEPPTPVTEIRWHSDDALPFPLCISADVNPEPRPDGLCPQAISVARGNIVLADHGRTLPEEYLGEVPDVRFFYVGRSAHCEDAAPEPVLPRFRPLLREAPLTQVAPLEALLFGLDATPEHEADLNAGRVPLRVRNNISARRLVLGPLVVEKRGSVWVIRNRDAIYIVRSELTSEGPKLNVYDYPSGSASMRTAPQTAVAAITLTNAATAGLSQVEQSALPRWRPKRDLLNSSKDALEFVAEVESGGTTRLRFGDDVFGKRPDEKVKFWVVYRRGNGVAGNIGAEAIGHIVSNEGAIQSARNPLPGQGGTEPEGIEEVRQNAPYAYRTQERAVTPEDYAAVAQRHPAVQRAAATFRWTGSWSTVFLTVDRLDGLDVDEEFERSMRAHMDRYRMAGYDLEVNAPKYVSLEVEMDVCVLPGYFREEVRQALLQVFSRRILPDGRRGVFHPDNFTFGQTVYLSRLYAAAENIAGVESVRITKFHPQGDPGSSGLESGKLALGRLEIVRLDNDPNHPSHGVFRLVMRGGK